MNRGSKTGAAHDLGQNCQELELLVWEKQSLAMIMVNVETPVFHRINTNLLQKLVRINR